jgi:hypothetical protein
VLAVLAFVFCSLALILVIAGLVRIVDVVQAAAFRIRADERRQRWEDAQRPS